MWATWSYFKLYGHSTLDGNQTEERNHTSYFDQKVFCKDFINKILLSRKLWGKRPRYSDSSNFQGTETNAIMNAQKFKEGPPGNCALI